MDRTLDRVVRADSRRRLTIERVEKGELALLEFALRFAPGDVRDGLIARFEDRTLPAPGPISGQLIEHLDNITSFRDDRFKDWFTPL